MTVAGADDAGQRAAAVSFLKKARYAVRGFFLENRNRFTAPLRMLGRIRSAEITEAS
jgi:hypothetical protein